MNMKLLLAYLFCASLVATEGLGEMKHLSKGPLARFFWEREFFLHRTFSGTFESAHERRKCACDAHFGAQMVLMKLRQDKRK